jgi:hypothetical protein
MTDYRTIGAHQVNKWIWDTISTFEYKTSTKAFDAYVDSGNTDGINLVPIIPSQQQPEFLNISNGAPFIVYNYILSSYASEWWICREQLVYIIYDNDEERLRAIHAYVCDLLKRMDWTARNINSSSAVADNFDFKYVKLTSASGPDEFSTEGGRQGAMIAIDYEYTVDINSAEGNGLRV